MPEFMDVHKGMVGITPDGLKEAHQADLDIQVQEGVNFKHAWPDPATGMVVNLKDLDRLMRQAVIDEVDHRHLNRDVAWLEGVIPTAENLALAFWQRLEPALPPGALQSVRVGETDKNWAECSRPR